MGSTPGTAKQEKPKCVWTGLSGKQYIYFVYELPCTFSLNQDGNYIYTKIVDNSWVPIYIGEGNLRDRVCENHHQAECIARKGATHVHAKLNGNEEDRKSEESDLLGSYRQAYEPNGCNVKQGG